MTGAGTAHPDWRARRSANPGDKFEAVSVVVGERELTFGEVVDAWRGNAVFRDFFINELGRTPYPAFFWEMPPIARHAMDQRYEYVAVEGSVLETLRANPESFLSELGKSGASDTVASFPNLSGDALVVVPKPLAGPRAYGHLGAFLRTAPHDQQHELLVTLAQAIDARLQRDNTLIWVSTAGMGVPWLHVRLDSRPKYYKHDPYRVEVTSRDLYRQRHL